MANEQQDQHQADVQEHADKQQAPQADEQGSAQATADDMASADDVIDTGTSDQASDKGLDQLQAMEEIQVLKGQLADLQLRAQAEIQNTRRRAEQDVERAHKYALDKFVAELLPVIDSLERAVDACKGDDPSIQAIREGNELTLSIFTAALAKFNVEMVDPQGQAFDPELHQAMSMVDAPDAKPNTVVAVMQKGFTLHGRLVRPAMVMVAKG